MFTSDVLLGKRLNSFSPRNPQRRLRNILKVCSVFCKTLDDLTDLTEILILEVDAPSPYPFDLQIRTRIGQSIADRSTSPACAAEAASARRRPGSDITRASRNHPPHDPALRSSPLRRHAGERIPPRKLRALNP